MKKENLKQMDWCREILEELSRYGVKEFCVGVGSRNAPFIELLSHQNEFKVYYFFEERSAGFFALGRIKKTKNPVCVLTTSGGAVANLLSPVIEACYSALPLVVLSADRPSSHRKKATPQAMEQKNIFSPYTVENYDLNTFDDFSISHQFSYPLHINVCLKEPLIDSKNLEFKTQDKNFKNKPLSHKPPTYFQAPLQKIEKLSKPLVILGEIPEQFHEKIESALLEMKTFIYAEAHSGLRESQKLSPLLIRSGEKFFKKIDFQSIIRIGSIPTVKFWRDLDGTKPVLNVSHKPFSGLSFLDKAPISFSDFLENKDLFIGDSCMSESLKKEDLNLNEKKIEILESHPHSEQALMRKLSTLIGRDDQVFLGNSLPIRFWDEFSQTNETVKTFTQRGINGIDGLISTGLGLSSLNQKTWSLIGDLSALYDLSGPWAERYFTNTHRLVIFNNEGGQIFSSLYLNPNFQTPHKLSFKKWAEFWGMSYGQWQGGDGVPNCQVIEIRPDNSLTKIVRDKIRSLL